MTFDPPEADCNKDPHGTISRHFWYDDKSDDAARPSESTNSGEGPQSQVYKVLSVCTRGATGAPAGAPRVPSGVIDAERIERQREWSTRSFGPDRRTEGILRHIAKECDEVRAEPESLEEWVDIAILALDGAWRAGHEPQAVIDRLVAKQEENFTRSYPDWRTLTEDDPIEHIREA